MTPPARHAAAIEILDTWLAGTSVEQALTRWARASRFAGSKDRAAIRDIVFSCVRCKRSYAVCGGAMTGRGLVLGYVRSEGTAFDQVFTGIGHAPSELTKLEHEIVLRPKSQTLTERLDIPDWLSAPLREALSEDFEPILLQMRSRAPVFLRVNLSRTSRDELIAELLREGIAAIPHSLCKTGLEVTENARKLRMSNSITTGLAEFQDISSQAICRNFDLTGDENILDYCAGGGGKSLALADRFACLGGTGQVFAHDIDPRRMRDLPERAKRARFKIETIATQELTRQKLYDVVFCDAPCSGSGAWRRAADGKWQLSAERLEELLGIQAQILDDAKRLVAPGGKLIYATCSLLNSENEDQIQRFLSSHTGWTCLEMRRFSPLQGGDGFFSAHLTPPSDRN